MCLLGTFALLGGCAGIPNDGAVTKVAGSRVDTLPVTQYRPPGPAPNASPLQIVRGFIDAMRAFPVSSDVAAEYLTPAAAGQWTPQERTVIYDDPTTTSSGSQRVRFRARQVATLDRRGTYTPATNRLLDASHTFRVSRVNGQWRIANPTDAMLISSGFFADYYQPVSLYFYDPTSLVLVPDPIYLARGDQLATNLVRGLLAGPTPDLRSEVHTVLPASAQVDVSVPIRPDGVADVRLDTSALALSDAQRAELAAQLVWTLRQVPLVVGVRVLAGGAPLEIPGAPAVEGLTLWDSYGPPAPIPGGQLFALRRGRLVVVQGTNVTPFPGPWRGRRPDLADFDVSLTNNPVSQLAAVSADRSRVLTWSLNTGSTRPTVMLRGGHDLTDPSWDGSGALWVAEHRQPGSELVVSRIADGGPRSHRVQLGPLARTRIEAFALSPDGLRIAAVARAVNGDRPAARRVYLGVLHRAPGGRVDRLTDVHPLVNPATAFEAPTDVEWADSTTVSLLARVGAKPPEPYSVRVDGSTVESATIALARVGATTLAVSSAPDSLTYVGNDTGGLWLQEPDGLWVRVSRQPLSLPDYPRSASVPSSTPRQVTSP